MSTSPREPSNSSSSERLEAKRRQRADHIEELIAEARQRGEFEHLRGTGERLRLDENIHAGDKALAYSLLKQNDMAPPEIERGKEIDAELARADELLAVLRRRREALRMRLSAPFASERRTYNLLRDKTEARYATALRSINSNILSLNILAPPALHRRTVNIEAKLSDFRAEFPRLEE